MHQVGLNRLVFYDETALRVGNKTQDLHLLQHVVEGLVSALDICE